MIRTSSSDVVGQREVERQGPSRGAHAWDAYLFARECQSKDAPAFDWFLRPGPASSPHEARDAAVAVMGDPPSSLEDRCLAYWATRQ